MKKRLLLIAVIILGLSLTGCDYLSDDTTTEVEVIVDTETYYEITSVTELQEIEMNKSYKLMNDLDLTGIEWEPIGTYSNPFLGNFDGNNYTITNLTITDDDTLCNGLFGNLSGDVWDLTLTEVSINYETSFLTYVGGLAGYTIGNIDNVSVSGEITIESNQSNTYVGMLLGYTQADLEEIVEASDFVQNVISNNSVTGDITVVSKNIAFVGGMIGKTFNTDVLDNYSNTNIDVILDEYLGYIGGLIGHNYGGILVGWEDEVTDPNIYINNNVAFSNISVTINEEDASIGGLLGYNQYGYTKDNYAETVIDLEGDGLGTTIVNLGGLVGQNWSSELINNVVSLTLNDMIDDEYTLYTDYIISGYHQSDKDFSGNAVYSTVTGSSTTIEGLTNITSENLTDTSFYQNTMNWEIEQINKIIE